MSASCNYKMIDIKHRLFFLTVLLCLKRRDYLIPGYMTIKEASEKWGLSNRWINTMCHSGKIVGAQNLGTVWAIPEDTTKPTEDGRVKTGAYKDWRKRYGKTSK